MYYFQYADSVVQGLKIIILCDQSNVMCRHHIGSWISSVLGWMLADVGVICGFGVCMYLLGSLVLLFIGGCSGLL